jgi:tetratricopeptide (TPR) repeat protein
LEDLHWADEMSLRLLAFLGRRIQSERVLVVITAREEELTDAPILRRTLEDLARARQLESLILARLSQPDTVALVRMLARARSDAATVERLGEQVWIASEGNPFMVVETMRALQGGATSQESPLPQRIREVISRRLERLGDVSQSLLGVASAIGREFEFQLLQRSSGLDEDATAEGVEELVRGRVLTAIGERLDFTHDRIREVAYSTLLPWRRKRLHQRIAEAIEGLHADSLEDHYEALGMHYREAEVWEKATVYLHQAGNKAVSRSAYRPAVAYFDQALAALTHLPERPDTLERAMDVRLDLRNALVPLGETARIAERLREAERIAIAAGDQRRLGRIACYMTVVSWRQGEYGHAISWGHRALTTAQALGDLSLEVETNFYFGQLYFSKGEYDRSLEFLAKNLAPLPAMPQGRPIFYMSSVTSRLFSVLCYAERGEFDRGRALGEEAVRLAEDANKPFFVVVALMAVGELHLAEGELERSIAILERALELCRTWDLPFGLPWVTGALGYAYALSGRLDDGISILEQVLTQTASAGLVCRDSLYLARRSEACLLSNRADDATALSEQALLLARERGERGVEAFALRVRGEIAAHQDPIDAEKAERSYRESLQLAHGLGMRPLVGHCHSALGTLYQRRRDQQRAQHHLAEASALFRGIDMHFWAQKAEAHLAEALIEPRP